MAWFEAFQFTDRPDRPTENVLGARASGAVRNAAGRLSSHSLALAPALLIAGLCFVIFPMWVATVSLTDSGLLPTTHLVGLRQYERLAASGRWWLCLQNLVIYALTVTGISLLVGYLLAILFQEGWPKLSGLRWVFLLPLAVSFTATGLVWRALLEPTSTLGAILTWAGLAGPGGLLVREQTAIVGVILASIWTNLGLCMTVFLAALQRLDVDLWRSARLDGIPAWRFYAWVVTPQLWRAFVLCSALVMATCVKTYEAALILTGGGPGFASDVPSHFIMEQIFERRDLALGAAGSVVLMIFALVFATIYARAAPGRIGR